VGYNVSYHELPKLDQQGAVKHGGGAYYLYLPTFLPSLPPSQSTGIGAYPDPAVGSASQAGLSPVSFHRFCMSQVYVCSARRIYWLYRLIALRYWTIARSHHLRLIAQVLVKFITRTQSSIAALQTVTQVSMVVVYRQRSAVGRWWRERAIYW